MPIGLKGIIPQSPLNAYTFSSLTLIYLSAMHHGLIILGRYYEVSSGFKSPNLPSVIEIVLAKCFKTSSFFYCRKLIRSLFKISVSVAKISVAYFFIASGLIYASSPNTQQLLLQTRILLKSSSVVISSSMIATLIFSLSSLASSSILFAI